MARIDVAYASERAKRTFDGFTRGQKTMLGLAGVAVVVGVVLLTRWSSEPSWSTLYSNLPPSEAAAVTQGLDAQGVKYQLTGGGSTIMVPREMVYRTRLDMSAKGLPADGAPGYSLLDKQGITTSEFRQRVDYQRALEGELAKTIGSIDGVEATSVHLVIPAQDLFSEDATKPTASVLVRTTGSRTLSSGQVQAVVHLVASSVEGLRPDDVTVADANGRVLAAPGQDGQALASTRAEDTKAFEDTMARSLQDMVQKVTGDGHAVVRVRAEMDYDRRSTTTESYADPAKRTAIAEKTTKENYTGTNGANATGVLGPNGVTNPATTVAGAPPSAGAVAAGATGATTAGANGYTRDEAQRDYVVGKVTEKVDAVPGTVTKLSIAVLLDGRSKVDATKLQSLISAAAGLNTARGDKLEVGQLNFDQSSSKDAATQLALVSATNQRSQMFDLIKAALLTLLALVAVFIAYRGAKRSTARTVIPIPLSELPGATLALSALGDGPISLAMGPGSENSRAIGAGLSPRPDIAALIDHRPEDVADTLREWLADRRSA